MRPAQKDVARGLHESLTLDHPLAVVVVFTGRKKGLENRGTGFLDLKEQRIIPCGADQHRRQAPGSNAAYATYPQRQVDQLVTVEKDPSTRGKRPSVLDEALVGDLAKLVGLIDQRQGPERDDPRVICGDP